MPNASQAIIEQIDRFLAWARRKISLHFADRPAPHFQEHEIWWASLGENIGSEMNGKNHHFERPVIVLKKLSNDMMIAVPSSTKNKDGSWYFPYHFEGRDLRAVMGQVRTISGRRLLRKMGHMDMGEFTELQRAITSLIKTDPPA